jgi:DNA topoisomerase VI subunit A
MNLKEMKKEIRDRLTDEQDEWLKEKVDLKAKDIKNMTTEELRRTFPGKPKESESHELLSTINDSRLIYTFIWQCFLKIKACELKPVKGNLRSFWYKELGPLMKLHNLVQTDEGPLLRVRGAGREKYLLDKMSKAFDQYVLRAFFRFKGEFQFQDPREAFRIIGRNKPSCVFYTEKEGLFWLCEQYAKKYGITVIASHGEPGLLTMEYFADELKARKVKNVKVAALTDYDPWGYNIAESFAEKLREPVFGFDKVITTHLTSLDLFDKDVIDYAKRDLTKVSPSKKKQVDKWVEDTGGIYGEAYGMHIDNANFDKVEIAVKKWLGLS